MNKERIVVGFTHVDLGWKKTRAEMNELQEKLIVALVDLCKSNPQMTYMIEQAYHFKVLKQRRPELFAEVERLVKSGQLEVGCNMVSSIETNLTDGECFVRNMQLGARWFRENLGVNIVNCEMIDTFGFSPQIPQLLRQLGFHSLFANRLGGNNREDVFQVVGLDGSVITVFGRMQHSPYCKEGHICFAFCRDRADIDMLFAAAEENPVQWALVMPYTENEYLPSKYVWEKMQSSNAKYRFGTLREVVERTEKMKNLVQHFADLNPEFTGTFSLRHGLKLENRKAENALLCAEQLCAIKQARAEAAFLEEAWWELLYVQFHDIISGSHPTTVYQDAMNTLGQVSNRAIEVMNRLMSITVQNGDSRTWAIWNPLPWERTERICIPLPDEWQEACVTEEDDSITDIYQKDRALHCIVHVPPMASKIVRVKRGKCLPVQKEETLCLENTVLKIALSNRTMIEEVRYKPTNRIVMAQANDLLVVERDLGSYQVEQPFGTEIACAVGDFRVEMRKIGQIQVGTIVGAFADDDGRSVPYRIEMRLDSENPYIDINVHVDWQSEASRLRLRLNTMLSSCIGQYEVPFGVVKRTPYIGRETAKGEWATHRFVVLEDDVTQEGIALINNGCAGVEVGYRSITTTLLRAPHREVAGMVPDDTSSDHGEHDFAFRLYFYHGGWQESRVAELAQAFNMPMWIFPGVSKEMPSALQWDNRKIVFSNLKLTSDGFISLRVYETTGNAEEAELKISRHVEVYASDLQEKPGKLLNEGGKRVIMRLEPFEVKTLLYRYV